MVCLSCFSASPPCVYPLNFLFTCKQIHRQVDLHIPFCFSSHLAPIQSCWSPQRYENLICWLSRSDLPLAPEKLEALISLDTGVWGFLFALAAFLTYQSPPCLLCFLCPAAPTLKLYPKTVTVAAVNEVINTCIMVPPSLTLTTFSLLHLLC